MIIFRSCYHDDGSLTLFFVSFVSCLDDDFIHNRPPQTRYEVHIEPHVDDFIPYRGYKRHCLDIDKRAKRSGLKISSPSKGTKLKTLPEGFEEGDFAGLL